MEGLGSGTLMKFGGAGLAVIGLVLAAIGTSSMGAFVFFGALVLIGAGLVKVGDHLEKRQAAQSRQQVEDRQ